MEGFGISKHNKAIQVAVINPLSGLPFYKRFHIANL